MASDPGYFDEADELLEELYAEQLEIERRNARKREQTEQLIAAALIGWLLGLGKGGDGMLTRPTRRDTDALGRRLDGALRPLRTARTGTGPGTLAGDMDRTLKQTQEALRKLRRAARKVDTWIKAEGADAEAARSEIGRRISSMTRDYERNVAMLEEDAARTLREVSLRYEVGSVHQADALAGARRFRLSRSRADTSLNTHPWALVRGMLIDQGGAWQRTGQGKVTYLVTAPPAVRRTLNPAGVTARYLGRVLTFAALLALYRDRNRDRRMGLPSSTPDTLGLHHQSREVYLPVPPGASGLAEEAGRQAREDVR